MVKQSKWLNHVNESPALITWAWKEKKDLITFKNCISV